MNAALLLSAHLKLGLTSVKVNKNGSFRFSTKNATA